MIPIGLYRRQMVDYEKFKVDESPLTSGLNRNSNTSS